MTERYRVLTQAAAAVAVLVLHGCGQPPLTSDAGGYPGDVLAPLRTCAESDCDDSLFCNGPERCDPTSPLANSFGCVRGASPCLTGQTCDEDADRCVTSCELSPDADSDGHDSMDCGGDDCDDANALIAPGLPEVCDAAGVDEDCDASTLGDDADGDGHVSASCCNGAVCGDDCDDADASRSPSAMELCNGVDDDCDGLLDAPLEDRDRDGFADASCGGLDCDDEDPSVHPGAVDVCDGVDRDCSEARLGQVDADGDGFVADSSCTPASGLLPGDCDDRSRAISPLADEACNARDDDCDGVIDEGTSCDAVAEVRVGLGTTCARLVSGGVTCWGRLTGRGVMHQAGDVLGLPPAVSVDVGADLACAALRSGAVSCWGTESGPFAAVVGIADAVQVAVGREVACARLSRGEVACWEPGRSGAAEVVVGVEGAVDLDVGTRHACAVLGDGSVWCWGANDRAQLGRPASASPSSPPLPPGPAFGVDDAVQVVTGDEQSCALRYDGSIWCWGRLPRGHIGTTTSSRSLPSPTLIEGIVGAELSASESRTCVRGLDGSALCPGTVPLDDLVQVSLGQVYSGAGFPADGTHGCGVRASGTVACWGELRGVLGDGGGPTRARPVRASGLSDARMLTAGGASACALRAGGVVACWGALGAVPTTRPLSSVAEVVSVSGSDVRVIDSGGFMHEGNSLGSPFWRRADAWGSLVDVATPSSARFAVTVAGDVLYERAAYPGIPASWSIRPFSPVPRAEGVHSGSGTAVCAHSADVVTCWSAGDVARAHTIEGSDGRVAVSDGAVCAIDGAGALWCWGSGQGAHPAGPTTTPLRVGGVAPASAVATNGHTTCAVVSGEVWCWGRGGAGQIGNGAWRSVSVPTRVLDIDDAVGVAMLSDAACAVRASGEVWCWGDDLRGQLGDGSAEGTSGPVAVVGLPR